MELTKSFQSALLLPSPDMSFEPTFGRGLAPTNCYAYALNCPQLGMAVVGGLNRPRESLNLADRPALTVEELHLALIKDGLHPIKKSEISDESHVIAAYIHSFVTDVHFYRRDKEGTWSHKPGKDYPLNICQPGYGFPITDPDTAYRQGYKIAAGYYKIPATGIPFIPALSP